MKDRLVAVLDYAALGWSVFPLMPRAKEPATKAGFYDATTNPGKLRRWFKWYPYSFGIRTGVASGIWVLDADGNDGFTNLERLESENGSLPPTLISIGCNGCHFFFRSDGRAIPCSTSKIAPGIDVRADGGYVVAPPSIHPEGLTYRWSNLLEPAPAPDWLIQLAQQRPAPLPQSTPPRAPLQTDGRGYGRAALVAEIENLTHAPPGTRNHTLNRASFCLHQLVAGGELDPGQVEAQLLAACAANGLLSDPGDGPAKVRATIRSGRRAGMQYPRDRKGRR